MLKKNNNLPSAFYGIALYSSLVLPLMTAPSHAATNVETLSGVKSEIHRQERLLSTRNKQLSELQLELEQQEKTISKLVSDIREANSKLEKMQSNIQALEIATLQLEGRKKMQVKQLKSLLNSQYRQGKHSGLSAILSGQGTDLDRLTVYAERLSKRRSEIIADLEATSTELQLQRRSFDDQKEQQMRILTQLKDDKAAKDSAQQARLNTIKKIEQQNKNSQSYLAELKENESRLTLALEQAKKDQLAREQEEARLAKLKAEQAQLAATKAQENKTVTETVAKPKPAPVVVPTVSMDGIGRAKGKLNWPVKGKLLHKFGSQQSGQLRWQGMVISAQAGSEVEAVHDGTVVLSNWLRGYGLMLVIDHGKGDMSFYGYNQTLLRKVGDKVKAGETIALVGNTGGRSSSGLYFEIRRKGNAINPSPWLMR